MKTWVSVPAECTDDMADAAIAEYAAYRSTWHTIWRAMLAAAPSEPPTNPPEIAAWMAEDGSAVYLQMPKLQHFGRLIPLTRLITDDPQLAELREIFDRTV